LHLEGSIEPETLAELDPGVSVDEARARYAFHDFAGFLEAFKWAVLRLRSPRDYALVAARLFERLREQNVRYAEITLSAGVILWKKQDFGAIYDAVAAASRGCGVEIYWVIDAIRHFGPDHALEVARLAVERAGDGVVAFGVGGDESRGPVEWFTEAFSLARRHGLKLVPHAGETAGPASVWAALHAGADRIGHGFRAIEDPSLVAELARRAVPLEICISSNVATGAVSAIEAHPVRRLYEAGVPVVLSTDDPAIFRTSISREFELAERVFGFSRAELAELARAAFRHAFRPCLGQ